MKRIFVVLAALLTLAGCGLGPGQVVADGKAPNEGISKATGAAAPLKRSELKITSPEELVKEFLVASAASPGDPAARETLMRTYIAGDWKPDTDVEVVHLVDPNLSHVNNTEGGVTVSVEAQHIGVLDDSGRLTPSANGVRTYKYDVISVGGEYMLRNPPKEILLLDVGGLDTYFEARPLYFYSGNTALVPDLRYVSQSLSEGQKSDMLVDWLYDGPSAWLAPSVKKPPSETRPSVTKAVFAPNGLLTIDLSASLGTVEFGQLKNQLAKTLVRYPVTGLTIKVQGDPKAVNYVPTAPPRRPDPSGYVIVDGAVHRLRLLTTTSAVLPLPADVNKNVAAVAFATHETAVAVVQQDGANQRLLVGAPSKPVQALSGKRQIGQPVWLDRDGQTLLVQADGHVYQIASDGTVQVDTEVPGLQAMAAYFDGRRLAMVIDGGLYLASRNENGVIALAAKQRLATVFDSVQGVAFGDNQLVVSGTTSRGVQLLRMNLDGTRVNQFTDAWQGAVSHIVADPDATAALFEVQGRGAYVLRPSNSQSLFDYIDWGTAQPPAENKVHISAPSFEG